MVPRELPVITESKFSTGLGKCLNMIGPMQLDDPRKIKAYNKVIIPITSCIPWFLSSFYYFVRKEKKKKKKKGKIP